MDAGLFDRSGLLLELKVAPHCSNVSNAAIDTALQAYQHESLKLRNGALVIRKHGPPGDVIAR